METWYLLYGESVDGCGQGELNILRQFVEGKLDRDFILEKLGDQLRLRAKKESTLPERPKN